MCSKNRHSTHVSPPPRMNKEFFQGRLLPGFQAVMPAEFLGIASSAIIYRAGYFFNNFPIQKRSMMRRKRITAGEYLTHRIMLA